MERYDKKILNSLLDSYENSLLSKGKNKINIHISFSFTQKTVPEYFNESSCAYEEIHALMKELEAGELLQIIWKEGKEGHIIQKVVLKEERVDQAYAYVKRTPKQEREQTCLIRLNYLKQEYDSPVAVRFMDYLSARIQAGKSVKEYVELSDIQGVENLVRAVHLVEKNEKSCYLREFSVKAFSDSKQFEKIQGKIGKIWNTFSETKNSDAAIEEILAEHGIYSTPNYVYLKGKGILVWKEQRLDLEFLHQGIGLSEDDLSQVQLLRKQETRKVITIENLTTFFRWQEENSLMIYLGGYHNSLRRKLLEKIVKQLPQAQYLHFGDIDVGGFEIYEDLCTKTKIPFVPYHMGVEELKAYEQYGRKLTVNDRNRLEKLLEKARAKKREYVSVLEYMQAHELKLEQECIGIHYS